MVILLASCSKEMYPIDEFVGLYEVTGTKTYELGTQTVVEPVNSFMTIYPTGKDSFISYFEAGVGSPITFTGIVENGELKIIKTEPASSHDTAKITSCEKDRFTIHLTKPFSHSYGVSGVLTTTHYELYAYR